MSRSIHRTRRDYEREERQRYEDRVAHLRRLAGIRLEISKKRRIKYAVQRDRDRPDDLHEAPPLSPESIPILVRDEADHVHHPASIEDLRAVLAALPPGCLNGLSAIELSLGSRFLDEEDDDWEERDPLTGRKGLELVPGVWMPTLLGTYFADSGTVRLYAFVCERLEPSEPGLEPYLRYLQLSTLVHEVAHHDDVMLRTGRGRWRWDDTDKAEQFARDQERQWGLEVVVPYLSREYGPTVESWERWLSSVLGVAISFETFASQIVPARGPSGNPYDELLGALRDGGDVIAARLQFARNLHYVDLFELALQVAQAVRHDAPNDLAARALEGDVLEHLGRLDEARERVDSVLAEEPNHEDALHVRILLRHRARDWEGLLESVQRIREAGSIHHRYLEGLAALHLGDDGRLAAVVERMSSSPHPSRLGSVLEALAALRGNDLRAAVEKAEEAREYYLALACKCLALKRLGRVGKRDRPTGEHVEALRLDGFDDWADELASWEA